MSLLDLQLARISYHKVKLWLEARIEATHLFGVAWWTEQTSLMLRTTEMCLRNTLPHKLSLTPSRKRKAMLVDMRAIPNTPGFPPIETNFLRDNFKILVWNCRGAGNNRFKQKFSDLVSLHKPEIVALLETKVALHGSLL